MKLQFRVILFLIAVFILLLWIPKADCQEYPYNRNQEFWVGIDTTGIDSRIIALKVNSDQFEQQTADTVLQRKGTQFLWSRYDSIEAKTAFWITGLWIQNGDTVETPNTSDTLSLVPCEKSPIELTAEDLNRWDKTKATFQNGFIKLQGRYSSLISTNIAIQDSAKYQLCISAKPDNQDMRGRIRLHVNGKNYDSGEINEFAVYCFDVALNNGFNYISIGAGYYSIAISHITMNRLSGVAPVIPQFILFTF